MSTDIMLIATGYALLTATLGAAAGLSAGLYLNSRYKRADSEDARNWRALTTDTAQWQMPRTYQMLVKVRGGWRDLSEHLAQFARDLHADRADPWEGPSPLAEIGGIDETAELPRIRTRGVPAASRLTWPLITPGIRARVKRAGPTPLDMARRLSAGWQIRAQRTYTGRWA